jgi:hypothetical protein
LSFAQLLLVIFAARLSTNLLGPLPAELQLPFTSFLRLFDPERLVTSQELTCTDTAIYYTMYCTAVLLHCNSVQHG